MACVDCVLSRACDAVVVNLSKNTELLFIIIEIKQYDIKSDLCSSDYYSTDQFVDKRTMIAVHCSTIAGH